MKIGIACDHAGFEYKEKLLPLLEKKGFEPVDFGTHSADSCDYPDFAHPLGEAIDKGELELGISLCGSGNGIAMTLNKHPKVRAALCWDPELAKLAKAHNNANVLSLPARFISFKAAVKILEAWLETSFEGGRHLRRINKIPLGQSLGEQA